MKVFDNCDLIKVYCNKEYIGTVMTNYSMTDNELLCLALGIDWEDFLNINSTKTQSILEDLYNRGCVAVYNNDNGYYDIDTENITIEY